MRNKLLTKIATISLGLAMAIGVSVGVANNRNTKAVYATAPNDSNINAEDGKFVIDFYDSGKLSSTSGTGLAAGGHYLADEP